MATNKDSKRITRTLKAQKNGPKLKAVAAALAHIEATHNRLFALQKFGESAEQTIVVLGMYGTYYAVAALCQQVRDDFANAIDAITPHPASKPLGEAFDALAALEYFMDTADASEEGSKDFPRSNFCRMVGDVLRCYVAQACENMERAEIALGGKPTWGYLANKRT